VMAAGAAWANVAPAAAAAITSQRRQPDTITAKP
jgi:hypothetical protein